MNISMAAIGAPTDSLLVLRMLRLLRVTWAARYVQALRPLLRAARLLLFLVRGLDGLAARFAQILNREFVFVPDADQNLTTLETERLWRGVPGASRAVVPGCAHAVHLEEEALFNALLARFLDPDQAAFTDQS